MFGKPGAAAFRGLEERLEGEIAAREDLTLRVQRVEELLQELSGTRDEADAANAGVAALRDSEIPGLAEAVASLRDAAATLSSTATEHETELQGQRTAMSQQHAELLATRTAVEKLSAAIAALCPGVQPSDHFCRRSGS